MVKNELPSSHEIPPGSLISATLIRLTGEDKLPDFMEYVQSVTEQLRETPGMLYFDTHRANPTHYLTCSIWTDQAAMEAFRNSGNHAEAMKNVRATADRTFSHHWQGGCIPTWGEVITKLNEAMRTRRRI